LDGNPLARQGKAGTAIGLATTSSAVGTFLGLFCLSTISPLLGNFALKFASWEFFVLTIFGVIICGNLTAPKDPLKGWIAGLLGLLLAQVGQDPIQALPRFIFGSLQLMGGLSLIPVLVGAYGVGEIVGVMQSPVDYVVKTQISRVIPKIRDMMKYWKTIIRSGIIGVIVGIIPGVGEDTAAWISYDFAKRSSKNPEEFGKGSHEGLIAAETGNNACIGGAIIPVLTLAVPGSAPAAVLLAAMWLHGIRPGPLLPIEQPMFIGPNEVNNIKRIVSDAGMVVPCIAALFFKCRIHNEREIREHTEILKRSLDLAQYAPSRFRSPPISGIATVFSTMCTPMTPICAVRVSARSTTDRSFKR
jgi:putative tricarboxylic transport membrane protein